uniref:Uncharacterized protein n=1 Tax=Aegilops tauschii subsp. strangulata TaxID=200361 RepID=A0A453AJH3_AEGTS
MGNCQAADGAAVVIQHPGDGKVERLHWPATAADVMRRNPGHYVALVVLHHVSGGVDPDPAVVGEGGGARITKVKLLKPRDTLHLGQVYRLITSQGQSVPDILNPPLDWVLSLLLRFPLLLTEINQSINLCVQR